MLRTDHGAYGIDADALSHRAISKGSPGYQPVVEMFGRWILNADGEIDRVKLGRVVFSDPQGLAQLERSSTACSSRHELVD